MHLKIRPAADWALAAACIHYCLQQGKFKQDFIRQHLTDQSGVLPYLQALPAADYHNLLAAAGIGEKAVAELVDDLYEAGPATCYLGYGPQRYQNGGLNIRAVNLLWAVTGNIGIQGGGINYANQVNQSFLIFPLLNLRQHRW